MNAPAFAFTCTKCGQCCKRGGPALSIDEIFKYQDIFITGLSWSGRPLPKKHVVSFKGEVMDVQKMRNHLASFAAPSFDDKDDTIHPHIYPCVTGYTMKSPCPALDADGVTCQLHDDKPTMCRSIPFDPALTEDLQGIKLREFGMDCITKTQAADAANIVYRDRKIVDPGCKADYDQRLAAMQKDQPTMTVLSRFIGDGTHFGPSKAEIMSVSNRGGWVETPMFPLIFVLLRNKAIDQKTAENYLRAQIVLIESGMDAASQRREAGRSEMMDYYLWNYRKLLDDDGKMLAPAVIDTIYDQPELIRLD